VAAGSPFQAGYHFEIGSSSFNLSCWTSRIVSIATATLVTLSNGSAVREVIGRRGLSTAAPALPVHSLPSANTIAADAPGTPVSATVWCRLFWSLLATASVSVGRGVPRLAALPHRSRPARRGPGTRRAGVPHR
jgi:hypothetical protein